MKNKQQAVSKPKQLKKLSYKDRNSQMEILTHKPIDWYPNLL